MYVNLKDKNNPTLRESVVSGDLPVARFCKMTSQVWSTTKQSVSFTHMYTRKWPRRSERLPITRSNKITFSKHSELRKFKQRQTHSNVVVANK